MQCPPDFMAGSNAGVYAIGIAARITPEQALPSQCLIKQNEIKVITDKSIAPPSFSAYLAVVRGVAGAAYQCCGGTITACAGWPGNAGT
jgi:hypothetical protein